jgi:hypothetical protein
MHSTPDLELTQPITRRLRQRDTGLRTSADPSLLVQSLLDLLVDKALEVGITSYFRPRTHLSQVIDAYHVKIKKFEREILLKPRITTVRNLHILSGDLILHKRTLEPIRTVIYGLRRYDVDRAAALIDTTAEGSEDAKAVGFMSHKSKIYLVCTVPLLLCPSTNARRRMCLTTWSTSSPASRCSQVSVRTSSTTRSMYVPASRVPQALTLTRADGIVRDERSDAAANARNNHLPPPHAPHWVFRDELRAHVDLARPLGRRVRALPRAADPPLISPTDSGPSHCP